MFTLVGILLLMVGASLVFAIEREIEGVDLQLVGWIMMAGGLTALFVAIARFTSPMNGAANPTRRVERDQIDHDGEVLHSTPREDPVVDHGRNHVRDHAASHGRTRSERGRHDRGWAT